MLLAYGHGRSFGIKSTVLLRSLPGILECGLWEALDEKPASPTFALITDIGNDVMYGVEPSRIADWVETCIDRLQMHGATIVMTGLPMKGLRRLRKWEYAIVKGVLFPRHPISFIQAIDRAEQVNEDITRITTHRGVTRIEPSIEWYGLDPKPVADLQVVFLVSAKRLRDPDGLHDSPGGTWAGGRGGRKAAIGRELGDHPDRLEVPQAAPG